MLNQNNSTQNSNSNNNSSSWFSFDNMLKVGSAVLAAGVGLYATKKGNETAQKSLEGKESIGFFDNGRKNTFINNESKGNNIGFVANGEEGTYQNNKVTK